MPANVCYLDCDGVLADFVGGAMRRHGIELPRKDVRWGLPKQMGFESDNDPKFWNPLGYDFWARLDKTVECDAIIRFVEAEYGDRVVILTSPCSTPGCVEGKLDWVSHHLPNYRRRVFLGSAKHLLAGPGKMLIDDHDANCDAFWKEGGTAYLFPRPWNKARVLCRDDGSFDISAWVGGRDEDAA
jgi:hypothetical protein